MPGLVSHMQLDPKFSLNLGFKYNPYVHFNNSLFVQAYSFTNSYLLPDR